MNNRLAIPVLVVAMLASSCCIAVKDDEDEKISLNKRREDIPLVASPSKISVLGIPGVGGFGSADGRDGREGAINYYKRIFGQNTDVTLMDNPPFITMDLGQNQCIKRLRETIAKNPGKKSILYCWSQGTATALNYLATEDKGKNIAALVIEAALASGNSAIIHNVRENEAMKILKPLTNVPGAYYWMPYGARGVFPFYCPFGKQPIKLIKDIPIDVPIIIVHSRNDPELPYQGALALYYGLRAKNHPTYLISKKIIKHIGIVTDNESRGIIRNILKKHGLQTDLNVEDDLNVEGFDVSNVQPAHESFKKEYDALMSKERNHVILGYTLMAGAAAAIIGSAKYVYDKFIPKSYVQALGSSLYNRLFSK